MTIRRAKAVFMFIADEQLNRPIYRRIGSAFINGDASISVILDAIPLTGRLLIRDVEFPTHRLEPAPTREVK